MTDTKLNSRERHEDGGRARASSSADQCKTRSSDHASHSATSSLEAHPPRTHAAAARQIRQDDLDLERRIQERIAYEVNKSMEEFERHHAKDQEALKNAEAKVKESEKLYASIQSELGKREVECQQLRDHWQTALKELRELKLSDQESTVDDDIVITKFKALKFEIHNLAAKAFSTVVPMLPLDNRFRTAFLTVTPHYSMYIRLPEAKSYFFEALIWHIIDIRCFFNPLASLSPTLAHQSEDIHKAVKELYATDSQAKAKFHSWRTQTAFLLESINRGPNYVHGKVANELEALLVPFIHGVDAQDFQVSFRRILDKVLVLSVIMAKAKSEYFCFNSVSGYGRYGFAFNKHFMDVALPTGHRGQVQFVITPGLGKYGNSDGEKYEEFTMLEKMGVCA